jgi:UDP-N-acetylglucosamine--N-acetylmuramyl-(pentapeptide) pyrophosphoryl-undecaprenol N-acetylglucosamine transferase
MKKPLCVCVAGGTGGHINAALSVGEAFKEKDHDVLYLTGKRHLDYKLFKGESVIHLDSRPLRTSNPFTLLKNIILNFKSFLGILLLFLKRRPKVVVGAGGYVCGPTLMAGFLIGVPVFIIEQNAVMGLTNKLLGWISKSIFVHFTKTKGLSEKLKKKVRVVGNPTRKSIQSVTHLPISSPLKILVFGGSLGAKQINNVIFDLIKDNSVGDIEIHHQIGLEMETPAVANSSTQYVPMAYIDHIQKEYEWCDVIIARSGASTVSELAIIKKPTLIFPFPQATDNHQFFNAQIFKEESDFSVEVLDPKLSHQASLERVKEFISKAKRGELKLTQDPVSRNQACELIIKEIENYVGTR